MKFLNIIAIFVIVLFMLNFYKLKHKEISYDEGGNKIITVTCLYKEQCLKDIGEECQSLGFDIIKIYESKISAKCKKELTFIDFVKRKVINLL